MLQPRHCRSLRVAHSQRHNHLLLKKNTMKISCLTRRCKAVFYCAMNQNCTKIREFFIEVSWNSRVCGQVTDQLRGLSGLVLKMYSRFLRVYRLQNCIHGHTHYMYFIVYLCLCAEVEIQL